MSRLIDFTGEKKPRHHTQSIAFRAIVAVGRPEGTKLQGRAIFDFWARGKPPNPFSLLPSRKQHLKSGHERQPLDRLGALSPSNGRVDLESAVRSPVRRVRQAHRRQAHPFDGFDRLPFDGFDRLTAGKLRVCDTAGRLRMTLSRVEWVRAPSKVEGLALAATSERRFLPIRGKTRFSDGAPVERVGLPVLAAQLFRGCRLLLFPNGIGCLGLLLRRLFVNGFR
jgi:hypothetical protein